VTERSREERIAAVASIHDPLRRAIFDLVVSADRPLGRDDVAERLDTPRGTVAFHLDRLATAGLLAIEFRRRSGRSGPGAGRPAKFYRRADDEMGVSIPDRHYDVMGSVLAGAIDRADAEAAPVRSVLPEVAREHGRALGAGRELGAALEACGYEPVREDGRIVLANCPFHRLAAAHTELVCSANLGLVEGLTEASGATARAEFTPRDGQCCVSLHMPNAGVSPATGRASQ
jgi:predicted ArsR family transcriptional regulator